MLKSIVRATDGSEYARRALDHVNDMTLVEASARVTIIDVVETGHGAGAVFLPRREEEQQIVGRLKDLSCELDRDGFTVALGVGDGAGTRPGAEIGQLAGCVN